MKVSEKSLYSHGLTMITEKRNVMYVMYVMKQKIILHITKTTSTISMTIL